MVQANYQLDNQAQFNELKVQSENNNSKSPFDIHTELDDLEEIIISGSRIPLTELTILDAELLVERLNIIKSNLPIELATATEIVNRQQEIISDAEGYACLIVKSAEEKAYNIVKESSIVRQAELDGAKIRLKTEQECEQFKKNTIEEIELLRENATAECLAIQIDADNYADSALGDIEQRLKKMLEVVQNGRQQIAHTSPKQF